MMCRPVKAVVPYSYCILYFKNLHFLSTFIDKKYTRMSSVCLGLTIKITKNEFASAVRVFAAGK